MTIFHLQFILALAALGAAGFALEWLSEWADAQGATAQRLFKWASVALVLAGALAFIALVKLVAQLF